MTRILFLTLSVFVLLSCNNGDAGGGTGQFDSSGYIIENIPGTKHQRAAKRGPEGALQEEGLFRNGLKEGTWIIYHPDGVFPAKVITYAEGMYNGLYMEFNERGQLTLRASYKNNILDGPWGKYRFGRAEAEAAYKNGKLDGRSREYDDQSGKLIKEVNYKDGKQHGMFRFFNEAGQVTLEYEYKDGEKVGGGIVEGPEEKAEGTD